MRKLGGGEKAHNTRRSSLGISVETSGIGPCHRVRAEAEGPLLLVTKKKRIGGGVSDEEKPSARRGSLRPDHFPLSLSFPGPVGDRTKQKDNETRSADEAVTTIGLEISLTSGKEKPRRSRRPLTQPWT